MEELKDILPKRLSETFKGETQLVTAGKLHIGQGTVSKWVTGDSFPPTEMLLQISQQYKVSVDWLLGLSEEKEIDSVSIERLTYEQIALVLHRLIEQGNIEIPDLARLETVRSEDEIDEPREPRYDTDFMKINDRALSFILRTREKFCGYDAGEEGKEFWTEKIAKKFNGVRLIKYTAKTQAALDLQHWPQLNAGDWASLLKEMGSMTPEQIDGMVNKKKEGRSNGR